MFITNKEYSLIGKIRSFKLRVFSSNLSALDIYLYIINNIIITTKSYNIIKIKLFIKIL